MIYFTDLLGCHILVVQDNPVAHSWLVAPQKRTLYIALKNLLKNIPFIYPLLYLPLMQVGQSSLLIVGQVSS